MAVVGIGTMGAISAGALELHPTAIAVASDHRRSKLRMFGPRDGSNSHSTEQSILAHVGHPISVLLGRLKVLNAHHFIATGRDLKAQI